ncbi:aminoglycoside 6'-N-acetyltransferase I [Ochrobactrum sp. 19YEA23]|nr:aminoglycoside 6'-N-acetyltransferase I [Ochrobactrum sp. 19YEA23]
MHMIIAEAGHAQLWAQLRHALWPDTSLESHLKDIHDWLNEQNPEAVTLLAESPSGEIVGFAEAAIRHDYVNGCSTSPVLYLEGIYVSPDYRQHGVARLLCEAIANWGRTRSCKEFASDVSLANTESQRFHAALGFDETERVIFYRKAL